MSKQPPKIRITNKDKTEYARLVKNAKAKARNVKKKYDLDLSMYVDVPTLDEVSTRAEFNQLKERLSSFTNRANTNFQFKKNELGTVASKHEIYEAKILTEKAQRQAERRRNEILGKPYKVRGNEVMTVADRFAMLKRPPTAGIAVPPDFNFNDFQSTRDFKSYMESIKKKADARHLDQRMELMKQNFIETLSLSFNDEVDHIVEMLKNLPADDFYELYFTEEEFQFEHYYQADGLVSGEEGDLHHLEKILNDYYEGKLDDIEDFKSFGNRV